MCPSTLFRRTHRAAVLLTFVAAAALTFAQGPLAYPRIDLMDGRSLRDVSIRSFDARTYKVLLIASGTAMTVPLALFPAGLHDSIVRGVPASGSTVSIAPPTKKVPLPPEPAPGYVAAPPAPVYAPAPSPEPAAPTEEQVVQAHRNLALAHAVRYFRYEYQVGSGSVRVQSVDFDATATRQVPGWTGRYETAGTAYLEYFDAAGITVGRAKCHFEVQTEANPGEPLRAVNFEHRT